MPTQGFLAIFSFSFVLAIGAVMSPGPISTAIVSQAPRVGWRVGPLITIGHAILELLIVVALAFGLQTFLGQPSVVFLVALLGGLILIWMGFSILRSILRGQMRLPMSEKAKNKEAVGRIVWLGILATLSNPFWFAWWISVPPSYFAQAENLGLLSIGAFYLGHISADFAWNSFLATALGGGRSWINDAVYRGILGLCALFFSYLGISFLFRAAELWGSII